MEQTERAVVVRAVAAWYADHRRALPWREPGTTPWAVLVSEIMLQQTPVARVLEHWRSWLNRWPTAAALATEPSSAAVAAWGRLGYPRRALRLHESATIAVERFGGEVPTDLPELRALPGVGEYTASAVASFAFGQRQIVADTNIIRLLTRLDIGRAQAGSTRTRADRDLGQAWLDAAVDGPNWAAASMELGALICTARTPDCDHCPISRHCRWFQDDRPEHTGPARRSQPWQGTDRQCRGRLLDLVRTDPAGVPVEVLLANWPDPVQGLRALSTLIDDRLVRREGGLVLL